MKVENNQENGWIRYTACGPGASPVIRQYFSGEISLISPADREARVTLSTAEEKVFVLSTLERFEKTGLGEVFEERFGDLKIAFTISAGLTIRRRRETGKQFHLTTQKSLDFVIQVLRHISSENS